MNKSIDAIRVLSMDMINKANSGHPGICLGAAPMSYVLYTKHINVSPKASKHVNRDRFVMSAGHGSALVYSLLHFTGYDLEISDLMKFRQVDSRTPGHPEVGHTDGVDATSGPLGQGITTAIGMAMAEKHLAAKYNKPGYDVVDHYTYTILGDGDLMEGVSAEASSLAGHLGIGKVIALYDSNNICLDGETNETFTEDVAKRYESYNWQVLTVEDGDTNLEEIDNAIKLAKAEKNKPSLIIVKTTIGYGTAKAGQNAAHGAPLGKELTDEMKASINWTNSEFEVPNEVYADFQNNVADRGAKVLADWDKMFSKYKLEFPDLAAEFLKVNDREVDVNKLEFKIKDIGVKQATRGSSEEVLNQINAQIPNLFGGSADLFSSTKNYLKDAGNFSNSNPSGKNIYFGVREFAMGSLANGMALHGGVIPQVSTFFVFSDYVKAAIRLSAIQNLPVIYVFTHDSIAVGEDGPTHEPVEQLTGLRAIPNLNVFRPSDYNETVNAYKAALSSNNKPSVIVLTRQDLPVLTKTNYDVYMKGAYEVRSVADYNGTIIATGSELELALNAAEILEKDGLKMRVVNMTENKLFDAQTPEYKKEILGDKPVFAVEMGSTLGWYKYAQKVYGIDTFGASGNANSVFEKFGFTAEKFSEYIKENQ